MATDGSDDEALVNRRRGWWIRVARESIGMNVDTLAELAGYKNGKGQVSKWENGLAGVPPGKFPKIARVLHLPDRYLVNPPKTDLERLTDERLAAGIRFAADAEQRDWDEGEGRGPEAGDEPDAEPGRQSA